MNLSIPGYTLHLPEKHMKQQDSLYGRCVAQYAEEWNKGPAKLLRLFRSTHGGSGAYGCNLICRKTWDIRLAWHHYFETKNATAMQPYGLFMMVSTDDLIEKSFRYRQVTGWFSQGLWIDIKLTQDLCMLRSIKGIPASWRSS